MNSAAPSKTVDAAFDLTRFVPSRLAVLSRLAQALLASALSGCDMTIAQWRVEICLVNRGPSTLNEIVAFTSLPQSSLSRAIARMEEKGLVVNGRNAEDRRYALIEITDKGRAQLVEAIDLVDRRCDAALGLDAAQEESFLATLNDLIGRLSNERA